jgi:hypothetical protein
MAKARDPAPSSKGLSVPASENAAQAGPAANHIPITPKIIFRIWAPAFLYLDIT